MHVIGTAGHVDHGKSSLVQALTGINPDRLKEEQERQMTIDLGFAWLTLPDGEAIGIVDVPGHRDFINHMLEGVGGIDAVLLVIAADEGIMPQTKEHLAILELLGISTGVVALSKIDKVENMEWLALMEEEVGKVLRGTSLEKMPIQRVSARTGEGLQDLVSALQACLQDLPEKADLQRPRLPIDRVFTLTGFGSVVTGTLRDGSLRIGDEVEILPVGLKGRIRGLQTHKEKIEIAPPGGRTAVNLSGIDKKELQRGYVLTRVGQYQCSRRLDVSFKMLADARTALAHNDEVKVFIGSAEIQARARVLGQEKITPGDKGWLQLELNFPTVAVRGDRFVLRRPSPPETLGGGSVMDAHPSKRHKRFATNVLESLHILKTSSSEEILLHVCDRYGPLTIKELEIKCELPEHEFMISLEKLVHMGRIINLSGEEIKRGENHLLISHNGFASISQMVMGNFEAYYQKNPLRLGMRREELRARLRMELRIYESVLAYWLDQHILEQNAELVFPAGHRILFSDEQKRLIQVLMQDFITQPYSPPTVDECKQLVGNKVFQALLDLRELIQVSKDVVFRPQEYQQLRKTTEEILAEKGAISLAEVRDHFRTSRRYALAIMEHLDEKGVTVREGDVRRLKKRN